MSLFNNFKKFFKIGDADGKKGKKAFDNLKKEDPQEIWEICGELGDGAFGKVYKVGGLRSIWPTPYFRYSSTSIYDRS